MRMTNDELDVLLNVPAADVVEAGRALGLSRSAAYAACARGDIPVIRIGRRQVVPTLWLRKKLKMEE